MINRNDLFITIRDNNCKLLDPVYVSCSIETVYCTNLNAVPTSDDGYVLWKVQEKIGDPVRELHQAPDGGVYSSKNLYS